MSIDKTAGNFDMEDPPGGNTQPGNTDDQQNERQNLGSLGNYDLLQRLGTGGFSEVYLGEHRLLKVKVAIKIIRFIERGQRDAILAEASANARLIHPHIIRIYDIEITDDKPYIVMDYAPHGTLRQRHPRGTRLLLTTVLSYVRQVADALQYAHDHGVIHRDVKPENLLLGERDEVLLGDFGIALPMLAGAIRLEEAPIAGTPLYMAPEQFEGTVLPASDQYALGVIVYEWLTGSTPFHGPSFHQIAIQKRMEPPLPLREHVPTIAPAVEQVILRALAVDPQERFPSVQAFAQALEAASREVDAGDLVLLRVRLYEDPLTAPTLTLVLSSITELYIKCWLIQRERFAELQDYSQAHQLRFAQEAQLIITKLSYNSPAEIVLLVHQLLAGALKTSIDAVLQAPLRYQSTRLDVEAKKQELERLKGEAKALGKERQLQLKEHEITLERQLLDLEKERFEWEQRRYRIAIETAVVAVETLQPGVDQQTKAMATRILVPHLLAIDTVTGLELTLLPNPAATEKASSPLDQPPSTQ